MAKMLLYGSRTSGTKQTIRDIASFLGPWFKGLRAGLLGNLVPGCFVPRINCPPWTTRNICPHLAPTRWRASTGNPVSRILRVSFYSLIEHLASERCSTDTLSIWASTHCHPWMISSILASIFATITKRDIQYETTPALKQSQVFPYYLMHKGVSGNLFMLPYAFSWAIWNRRS